MYSLNQFRADCSVQLGEQVQLVRRKGERRWHALPEMLGFLPFPDKSFARPRFAFSTGLYDGELFAPHPVFTRDWHIDYRQCFARYETQNRADIDFWQVHGGHPSIVNMPRDYGVSAPECLIFARSQDIADEVLSHINAAMLLFNGYSAIERDEVAVRPDRIRSRRTGRPDANGEFMQPRISASGIVDASGFVAKIWAMRSVRLALARLFHSTHIAYFHPLDASPRFGNFDRYDPSVFSITAYALAITAAYSSVEELDCQPRAPKRGIPVFKDGQWNPSTVSELRERLSGYGVNPDEEVVWRSRGRKRTIEGTVAPPSGKPADWNRRNVNDKLIPLSQAIFLSSRIRNKVSAHDTKPETHALAPTDLMNVQAVCRQLVLARGGLPLPKVAAGHRQSRFVLEFHQSERRD